MNEITKEDIEIGFLGGGVKKGDTLMVHSSFKSLGGVEGGPKAVIEALLGAVGDMGTIVMPTFNWDFGSGIPYDHLYTKSQMGILTEIVRNMPEASRIHHPLYSFAIIGHRSEEFGKINNISAYGPDSAFAKLIEIDGRVLTIGLPYQKSFTIIHHVEEMSGCNYRFMKSFTGDIIFPDRHVERKTYYMNCRDVRGGVLTQITPWGHRLEELGVIGKFKIGGAEIKLANARDIYDTMKYFPISEPHLLREVPPGYMGVADMPYSERVFVAPEK